MTLQTDTAIQMPSIASSLEARAEALVVGKFLPPENAVRRCTHATELGEASERVKRWITLREQMKAQMIKYNGDSEAWTIKQQSILRADRKQATEKLVNELDRRIQQGVALAREYEIMDLICDYELRAAYPDVPGDHRLVVDSDWTVLQIDHSIEMMFETMLSRFDEAAAGEGGLGMGLDH